MKLAEVRAALDDYVTRWRAGQHEAVIAELADDRDEGWIDRIMLCSLLADRLAKEGMCESVKHLVHGLQVRRLAQAQGSEE